VFVLTSGREVQGGKNPRIWRRDCASKFGDGPAKEFGPRGVGASPENRGPSADRRKDPKTRGEVAGVTRRGDGIIQKKGKGRK